MVRSRGEAEGLVFGFDPDVDDPGFLALRGVGIFVGQWGERADGYGDDYAARAHGGFGVEQREAFHWAVVTRGSPVGEKILHGVARAGFPDIVGFGGVSGDEGVEEVFCRLFFRVVADREVQADTGQAEYGYDGEN